MINLLLTALSLWIGILIAKYVLHTEVSDETLRLLLLITLLLIGVELDFSAKLWSIEQELKKRIRAWCGGYHEDD